MKKSTYLLIVLLVCLIVGGLIAKAPAPKYQIRQIANNNHSTLQIGVEPHDHWLTVRSYPNGFNQEIYLSTLSEIRMQATYNKDSRDAELGLDWQQEGPGNIGGRIDVLTLSPTDHDIIYAGATNGGIFKTIDGGENWDPIFDDQPYLSIGAITLDPENESVIYAGTGDRNFTGTSFIGNGIYKSEDAGENWINIGLEETGAVTEIIIDPEDSDRIFASTLGNPHVKTSERGVYRSDDGGETWVNKLFIADSAGAVDLVMDPTNADVLYAAGYNRMRNYFGSTVSGPNARIYKTIDGGESWSILSGGLPMENDCRIGLAISNDDPNTIFALYVDGWTLNVKDIYKSTNGGDSWTALNVYGDPGALPGGVMGGFGWYFGEVYLNPYNNDHLIIPGVDMYQSLDGGGTWEMNVPAWWTYEVHADKHAIAFLDENSYIIATDGGLYRTDNNGASWTDIENIPITQFYHIDVHPHEGGIYGGGAQDNGSMSGNAASFNTWERLFGGDGFRVTFLEEEEGAAYFETQNGGLRHVAWGGFTTNISPEVFGMDRINWDMPYIVNEEDAELFVGSAHVQYMFAPPFGSYEYISDDLTRVGLGEPYASAYYHNITEIDQPIFDSDLLYVGTSDGLVWRGERTGDEWDWVNITGDLPNHYVTGIRCSPNDPQTVYVTFSGYKVEDDQSFIYKSSDFGETWEDISSDLPDITVNDVLIVEGYENDEYLFAALDGGVYFSENNGTSWDYLGVGLPSVTVSELHMDSENEKLIAGTYARSMWSYDISWMEPIIEEPDDSGIAEFGKQKLEIYPNPVSDVIHVVNSTVNKLLIFDLNGKLMYSTNDNGENIINQVNVEHLPAGQYVIVAGDYVSKFIKN